MMIKHFLSSSWSFVKQNKWSTIVGCIVVIGYVLILVFHDWNGISAEWMSSALGMVIALFTVSLPIVISNISEKLDRYQSKFIKKVFQSNIWYIGMISMIAVSAAVLVLFMLGNFDDKEANNTDIYVKITLGIVFVSLFVFWKFISTCVRFVFYTDERVKNICENEYKRLYNSEDKYGELYDILNIMYRIPQLKMKEGINADNTEYCRLGSKIFCTVMASTHVGNNEGNEHINDFVSRYYETNFTLWEICFRKFPRASYTVLYYYGNTITKYLANKKDEDDVPQTLFFIYQRIAQELTLEDSQKIPYCKTAPFDWYFFVLNSEDLKLNVKDLQLLSLQLFQCMRNIIDNGNVEVFREYIRETIEGTLSLRVGIANEMDSTYSVNSMQARYSHVQYLTLLIASYALFKGHHATVRQYLYYNQPLNSSVIYGNKDICPDNLQTIISWYTKNRYTHFDMSVSFLWPEHNDLRFYKERLLAIIYCRLLCRHNPNNHYTLPTNETPQYYSYMVESVREFVQKVESLKNDTNLLDKLDLGNVNIEVQHLQEVIDQAECKKKEYEKNTPLDSEKILKFQKGIIDNTEKASIWLNVLRQSSADTGNAIKKVQGLKLATVMEKSLLQQGDKGIYIGFGQAMAVRMADIMDWHIERLMKGQGKIWCKCYEDITAANMSEKIFQLTEEDIVVFINYFGFYRLVSDKPSFKWKKNGNTIGVTEKGTEIYSFGDRNNNTSRVYIFKKDDISQITLQLNEDNIKISDLNDEANKNKRTEIKTEGSYIPKDISSTEDADEYLKKYCLIEIDGSFSYQYKQGMRTVMFENI